MGSRARGYKEFLLSAHKRTLEDGAFGFFDHSRKVARYVTAEWDIFTFHQNVFPLAAENAIALHIANWKIRIVHPKEFFLISFLTVCISQEVLSPTFERLSATITPH